METVNFYEILKKRNGYIHKNGRVPNTIILNSCQTANIIKQSILHKNLFDINCPKIFGMRILWALDIPEDEIIIGNI